MLTPTLTGPFRKDFTLMEKRRKNMDLLCRVMDMIIHEEPLPPERRNHPLHGIWAGFLECHIQGDWVLIYRINNGNVHFARTGSHSDLY